MKINYTDILDRLEPFKDRVFWLALTEQEVVAIEAKLKVRFPVYFREFLLTFGVKQDFVHDFAEREGDFNADCDFLPDEWKTKLISVSSGEDYKLLNVSDPFDTKIYEWRYWEYGEVEPLDHNFQDLLEISLKEIKENYNLRYPNSEKKWHVQFSIETDNPQLILNVIGATQIERWGEVEISPADVHCSETYIQLGDKIIPFWKREYIGWSCPSYCFDWQEPAEQLAQYSFIKELDKKLKGIAEFKKYVLIDYGILALDNADDL